MAFYVSWNSKKAGAVIRFIKVKTYFLNQNWSIAKIETLNMHIDNFGGVVHFGHWWHSKTENKCASGVVHAIVVMHPFCLHKQSEKTLMTI